MPEYMIKHTVDGEDLYLAWSTVIDAPLTLTMTTREVKKFLRETADANAYSFGEEVYTVEDIVGFGSNAAGLDETSLTAEQIIDYWFINKNRGRGRRPLGTIPD